MDSQLFTIFCRCDEAVYVSQLRAEDPAGAVKLWIAKELSKVGEVRKQRDAVAAALLHDLPPSPIDGCENAWVATAYPIWLDIVLTRASGGSRKAR